MRYILFLLCNRKFLWNPLLHKSKRSLQRCALGALVDGCQGNRVSARECASGTFFFTKNPYTLFTDTLRNLAFTLNIGRLRYKSQGGQEKPKVLEEEK